MNEKSLCTPLPSDGTCPCDDDPAYHPWESGACTWFEKLTWPWRGIRPSSSLYIGRENSCCDEEDATGAGSGEDCAAEDSEDRDFDDFRDTDSLFEIRRLPTMARVAGTSVTPLEGLPPAGVTDRGLSESRSRLFVGVGLALGNGKSPTEASSYRISHKRPAKCHLLQRQLQRY